MSNSTNNSANWWAFVLSIGAFFVIVALLTLFPDKIDQVYVTVVEWIFAHVPVGWLFLIGAVGTGAFFVIAPLIIIYEKLQ